MANNGRFALILIGLVIFLSYYALAIGQKAFVSEAIFTPTQIFLLVHSIYLSMAFLFFSLERTAIDLGSVITTKFSKNRILQLFVLMILVCLLFNFIYLGGVK